MKKFINNLRFRSKIIWLFGVMFFFTTTISGLSYYQYASNDIEENFKVGAEDVLAQIVDTLGLRLGIINQRANGMLANYTFMVTLSDYLNNPNDINMVKALGTIPDFMRDFETGEGLIHSTYIYTDKGSFDNFVRMRNWKFDFKDSIFYKSYQTQEGGAIRWFPIWKDEIFQDNDQVIPCVWLFSVPGYVGNEYLVIQLKKTELERLLEGKYEFFDKILILDGAGNVMVGSPDMDPAELRKLSESREGGSNVITSDFQYEGDSYLVTFERLKENGWQIYGLKSRQSLLGSLKILRNIIFEIMGVVFLIGVAVILLLSHQLTNSLRRLEKRMSCVEKGDLGVRFFYPYKDEVGSLAKSFNYMIGEIQSLVRKQEETIEELKRERDYVAEVQKQKRKAELKALQAQIIPHFLYNTLNAITWQAADQGAEEISILSNSLGKFFRIGLSKGAEVITLREELEHVSSYLDIQSIRYHSRLSYEIHVDDRCLDFRMIKLILQPLAENSIYHGIKEKQGAGIIKISVSEEESGKGKITELTVWDNGAGIPEEKLAFINETLKRGGTDCEAGYGIYNVNERIRLFYGKDFGLYYESSFGHWTKAVLRIPAMSEEVE